MVVVGLTGGIASGKSTVSRMLSEMGATIIDADLVGHEALLAGSEARREVVAAFGKDILDENGEVDRGKLADIVFRDRAALDKLNEIMHPGMRKIVEQRIDELRSRGVEVVVLEAALLIEAGWTDMVDRVWVTVASENTVVNRLCEQKGLSGEQARARIKSQMPVVEKVKHADAFIENDSDLDALRNRVAELWRELRLAKSD